MLSVGEAAVVTRAGLSLSQLTYSYKLARSSLNEDAPAVQQQWRRNGDNGVSFIQQATSRADVVTGGYILLYRMVASARLAHNPVRPPAQRMPSAAVELVLKH
jgi:hypothetical protein